MRKLQRFLKQIIVASWSCRTCGNNNPDDKMFCQNCGQQ